MKRSAYGLLLFALLLSACVSSTDLTVQCGQIRTLTNVKLPAPEAIVSKTVKDDGTVTWNRVDRRVCMQAGSRIVVETQYAPFTTTQELDIAEPKWEGRD
jgi:hypothetical protein